MANVRVFRRMRIAYLPAAAGLPRPAARVSVSVSVPGPTTMQLTPGRFSGSEIVTSLPAIETAAAGFPFTRTAELAILAGTFAAAGSMTTAVPAPGWPHTIVYRSLTTSSTGFAPAFVLDSAAVAFGCIGLLPFTGMGSIGWIGPGGLTAEAAVAVAARPRAQTTPTILATRTFTSPSSVPPSRRACVNRIPDTWSGSIAPNLHDRAPTKGAAMNNRLRLLRLPLLLALGAAAFVLGGTGSATSAHDPFQRPAVPPSSYVAAPPATWIKSTGGSLPCLPGGYICYRPADMAQIYNLPANLDGTGQTIIVVDAFGSSSIKDDLAQFDAESGLPDPPSFTIIGHNGKGNLNDPNVQGWAVETSLDVEWAHAFAPGADIVLSVSRNDNAHALTEAVQHALPKYPGAIVSQSFGGDETFVRRGFIDEFSAHRVYAGAVALGDSILAATGDWGASGTGDTSIVAWYPATDPLVTAVGGTEGNPWPEGLQDDFGNYGGEETWNESWLGGGATGGGPSQIFPSPGYQHGVSGYAKRTVPDVALNASAIAGAVVVWQGLHGIVGGTSVGTPEWAGILALANQARTAAGNGPLGQANAALYSVAKNHPDAFHDITTGDNTFDPAFTGFSAGPGYDLTTGLGTPDVAKLVGYLTGVPGAPAPARLQNIDCQNQQLTGAYKNVHVRNGSWCDLSNATVVGNVDANKASGVSIVGSTISGDLHVNKTTGSGDPFHPGVNVICNSVVMGNVEVQGSAATAPFSIGGAGCLASADITGSTASVVGNDFHFNNNAALGNDVTNNTIFGDLECNHDGGVTGGGNRGRQHHRPVHGVAAAARLSRLFVRAALAAALLVLFHGERAHRTRPSRRRTARRRHARAHHTGVPCRDAVQRAGRRCRPRLRPRRPRRPSGSGSEPAAATRCASPAGTYTVGERPAAKIGGLRPHHVRVVRGVSRRVDFFIDTGIR